MVHQLLSTYPSMGWFPQSQKLRQQQMAHPTSHNHPDTTLPSLKLTARTVGRLCAFPGDQSKPDVGNGITRTGEAERIHQSIEVMLISNWYSMSPSFVPKILLNQFGPRSHWVPKSLVFSPRRFHVLIFAPIPDVQISLLCWSVMALIWCSYRNFMVCLISLIVLARRPWFSLRSTWVLGFGDQSRRKITANPYNRLYLNSWI